MIICVAVKLSNFHYCKTTFLSWKQKTSLFSHEILGRRTIGEKHWGRDKVVIIGPILPFYNRQLNIDLPAGGKTKWNVVIFNTVTVIDSFLFFKFFSILLGSIFSKFASRHIKNSIFLLLKIRPVAFCCRINIVPPKPSRIPSICSLSSPLEKCPCVRRKRLKNHKTMWGS